MFVCYTAVCCSTKFVVAGTQNPMVIIFLFYKIILLPKMIYFLFLLES